LPSLLANQASAKEYVISRLFRIFPGLLACVLICICLGLFLSSIPAWEYLTSKEVWQYFFYNGLTIEPRYSLLGVFSGNPWPNSVNGSLWTLPLEIRCYLLLLLIWCFGFFKDLRVSSLALLIVFVAGMTNSAWLSLVFGNPNAGPYVACFALGAMCRIYDWGKKLSLIPIIVIIAALFLFWNSALHQFVFGIALASGIFFISRLTGLVKYIPELPDDISYGIYLYAYPIQQIIIFLKPDWSLSMQLLISFLAVFIIAYLTRIFVEKPCLKIKDTLLQRAELRRL
jgi:peptidoglycan/LPS O-acetylase OafA/YrhL